MDIRNVSALVLDHILLKNSRPDEREAVIIENCQVIKSDYTILW